MSWTKRFLMLLHILAIVLLGVALVVSARDGDLIWSLCLAAAISSEVAQIIAPFKSDQRGG